MSETPSIQAQPSVNAAKPQAEPAKNVSAALFVYPRDKAKVATVRKGEAITLQFYCLGDTTIYRYKTLFVKEPDTIEWLDSIPQDAVLWDIGANIGIYTIYAAMTRGCRVLAFEPLASNYYILNMNIMLNKAEPLVNAYCMAFADHTAASVMHMTQVAPGAAGASFEEAVDDRGRQFKAKTTQGMIGFALDEYIERFNPEFPTHMKIDVDGIEDKIIRGAQKTFRDPRLRSISIELDAGRPEHTDPLVQSIVDAGFIFDGKKRSQYIAPNSTIHNYRFHRE